MILEGCGYRTVNADNKSTTQVKYEYFVYFTPIDQNYHTGKYHPHVFWSVTRYSALTRNTIAGKNDLFNAYNTKADTNGNITVTFSIADPKDGTYWMPVNAGKPYYFVVRYYKPDVDKLPPKPCK